VPASAAMDVDVVTPSYLCEPEQLLHSMFNGFSHKPCSSLGDVPSCIQLCGILGKFVTALHTKASRVVHSGTLLEEGCGSTGSCGMSHVALHSVHRECKFLGHL
jgi:hypothetical protein